MAGIALQTPVYQPAMRIITNITQANPAVVTTSFAHNYMNELIVRLNIPNGWGMDQANQLFGDIVVLSPTTFAVNIDTTQFYAFVTPSSPQQYPQVVPFGEDNDTLINAVMNVLPF